MYALHEEMKEVCHATSGSAWSRCEVVEYMELGLVADYLSLTDTYT